MEKGVSDGLEGGKRCQVPFLRARCYKKNRMGRAPQADEAGGIHQAINRSNAMNDIFFKQPAFEALERLMAEGLEMFPVDLIAYLA